MTIFDITSSEDGGKPATMSSREIAELVQLRHDNVKRTIESLAGKGVIGVPQIEEYLDTLGRKAKEYQVGKRDSYVIVAQLSPEFTARLVDRWEELETRSQSVTAEDLLRNPIQLLGIAQGYALQIVDMQRDMAVMETDVKAFERIAKADGSLSIREAAKGCQMQEKKFIAFLMEKRWCYRQPGTRSLLGYADKVTTGFVEHKTATYSKSDGSEGIAERARITAKGMARLAKILNLELEAA